MSSIVKVAEPLLGVNRDAGERAHIRILPGDPRRLFITKSPHDTLFFPTWHDREAQPRYTWAKQDDGMKFGYLVDGATPGGEVRETGDD